jgi:uncharacterized protein (TIGR02687 family)
MSEGQESIIQRINAAFAPGVRVVLWEDPDGEFAEIVTSLELQTITLIVVDGNELTTKRRVLRECPDARFLLYRAYRREPLDDLLYDVKLAARPFSCRQSAFYAEECGIDAAFMQLIEDNSRFFANKERRSALAASQLKKDTADDLTFALLAACFNIKDGTRNDVMREIIARLIMRRFKGDTSYERLLENAGLLDVFWDYTSLVTGYSSGSPSIEDLGCVLLTAACAPALKNPPKLTADANIIISKLSASDAFEDFIAASKPAVLDDLQDNLEVATLEQLDYLPEFDEQLLAIGLERLNAATLAAPPAKETQAKRSVKYWHKKFAPYYATLTNAAELAERLAAFERELPAVTSAKAFVQTYSQSWAYIDRSYRLLNVAYNDVPAGRFKTGAQVTISTLLRKYDRFLEDLASAWQAVIGQDGGWPPADVLRQDQFYPLVVRAASPSDRDGERVAVIISDGFRFELATELKDRLLAKRSVRKLNITLESMLSSLPSYTQLGMAALLPHQELAINPSDLNVTADARPTAGVNNRAALLEAADSQSTTLGIGQEPSKDALKNSSIVYAYLNTVDKVGDDKTTEHKIFAAVEEAYREIEKLADNLLANGYKEVIVTADHGFIYQTGDLNEYSFIDIESLRDVQDAVGGKNTRRFIVASVIPQSEYLMEFKASDLSLEGDYSVALPRGIRRIRVKGAGAAYVHGGATLQEMVIPVLRIRRDSKNSNESRPSAVELFDVGRAMVTGSGISATLYQVEPVGADVIASQVEVAVFSADDKLLSNEISIPLVSAAADNESRKNRFSVTLTSEVDECECEQVELRVRRRRGETNKYETLIAQPYRMRRAMGMDF